MKKLLICFLMVLLPSLAHGATLNFSWTPNLPGVTVGYAIVIDNGSTVAVDIPDVAVSTASYETTDNSCHTFSIYAYSETGEHSDIGNMVTVCPKPGKADNFQLVK